MFKQVRIFSILLLGFGGFIWAIGVSHATSCDKDYVSLESAFIDADVVFWGNLNKKDGANEYLFDVKELYKAPEEFKGSKMLSVISSGIGSPRFTQKMGYVLFGHISYLGNGEDVINVYPCDKNSIIPDELPSFIDSLENSNEEERRLFSELIFVGEVQKVSHDLNTRKRKTPSREEVFITSEIDFRILDVLKEEDDKEINISIGDKITVDFLKCGQGYFLKEKYIVYASSYEITETVTGEEIVRHREISGLCRSWTPLQWNMKDILRDFSRKKFD